MPIKTISVTKAARDFAACISSVSQQGMTFVLLVDGSPVARLEPVNERVCSGRDLAAALAKIKLPEKEAAAWHRDLQAVRKTLKPPRGKWHGRGSR